MTEPPDIPAAGTIIAVNATWSRFASSNGLAKRFCGPGANYLRSCDEAKGDCSEEAAVVAEGIRKVLADKKEYFQLEYPCHSPVEKRWFSVRVTRFQFESSVQIVVTHDDITQRVLAELALNEVNRRLRQLAVTDGLTGIANRRSFDVEFKWEWKRYGALSLPLSVAIVDVDCFKQFNDQNGHLAGDDCLRAIARVLESAAERANDFVARYCGEEFAILLPATETAGAASVLLEILETIRALAISHTSSKVSRGIVTVSIGYATAIAGDTASAAAILSRADHALYEAKSNGRDQLICADELPIDTFVPSFAHSAHIGFIDTAG